MDIMMPPKAPRTMVETTLIRSLKVTLLGSAGPAYHDIHILLTVGRLERAKRLNYEPK
jgi:hypothetical protein